MKIHVEKHIYETIEAEIRHCFCCGNNAFHIVHAGLAYQIYCRVCSARGCTADTPQKAIELHNWVSEKIDQTEAYLNYHASR